MNFRTKIIAGAVVFVLIVIVLALVLRGVFKKRADVAEPSVPSVPTSSAPVQMIPSIEELKKNAKPVNVQEAKKQASSAAVVREFVERFGSFSIDSAMANFDEVRPLTTAGFAEWMDGYRKAALAQLPQGVKGITTRLISLKNTGSNATSMSFEAVTQREESSGAPKKVYYQRMLLKLVLEDSAWKVDAAYWQAKE